MNPPTTHRHPLYRRWQHMISRCRNTDHISYRDYGGRGIQVCDRWKLFKNFAEDVWPTFQTGLTLERIDNAGNYCPENFKWATYKEQNRNRRDNRFIEFDGQRMCLAAWADKIGIVPATLSDRIARGMPLERALAPILRRKGQQLCKISGCSLLGRKKGFTRIGTAIFDNLCTHHYYEKQKASRAKKERGET